MRSASRIPSGLWAEQAARKSTATIDRARMVSPREACLSARYDMGRADLPQFRRRAAFVDDDVADARDGAESRVSQASPEVRGALAVHEQQRRAPAQQLARPRALEERALAAGHPEREVVAPAVHDTDRPIEVDRERRQPLVI